MRQGFMDARLASNAPYSQGLNWALCLYLPSITINRHVQPLLLCNAGVQSRGVKHVRRKLYQLNYTSSPFHFYYRQLLGFLIYDPISQLRLPDPVGRKYWTLIRQWESGGVGSSPTIHSQSTDIEDFMFPFSMRKATLTLHILTWLIIYLHQLIKCNRKQVLKTDRTKTMGTSERSSQSALLPTGVRW